MNCPDTSARVNVLGIGIDPLNWRSAIDALASRFQSHERGYVCFTNVHGVMEAQRDPSLRATFTKAAYVMPDGMPMVWVGRHAGHARMERVTGPDVMLEVISGDRFRGLTHFFYGGKPGVAEELRQAFVAKYPWVKIVGTYTPPFGDLSSDQEEEFIRLVEELRPDAVWIGISTPRQDRFMERYIDRLNTKLMFGVGAAFDFHTGTIHDCPDWVKQAGLQWVHRLLQDPKHLWRRYVSTVPAFMFGISLQMLGLRAYALHTATTPPLTWSEPNKLDASATEMPHHDGAVEMLT